MIFPELGPQYYDEKHKGILSRMETAYAESITINQSFWAEADTDSRFLAGDQTIYNDIYGNLPANRRRNFNFNRILRVINMISGHQRRNRKSTIAIPIENGDSETADQFTKVLMWNDKQEGVLETISEAFEGALTTGMNLLHVWMDYRTDPISGNIKVDNCSYNSFLIDPFFRKQDLSDCNFVWKRSFLTKRECISLLPEHEEEILGLWGNDSGNGRDGKFQFMPESYGFSVKHLLTYDEYYYRDYRKQKMLADSQTGEVLEWRSQDEDRLKEFLHMYPQVTVIEQDIPTVRLAIVVQGKVMYDGPNPMGIDEYPFVPVFAYYFPQLPYFPWRCSGVVRHLRDAQYLYNRRKIIELDIMESQINSGYIYKENALVNPKDIFLQGQGKGLALKDEAQMTDVIKIPTPSMDASVIELSKIMGDEIQVISGASDELLGFDNKDTLSGYHSMLKQSASLTTLQGLFDNLDRAQKLLGNIRINLIQANFMPGKIKKILENEEPTAQFYNKGFGIYHANVEEGLNTSTQRQMQFAQLLMLKTEAGLPVPNEDLMEASTIQGKKKLIENMQKQQQAQQQQIQQQAQAQMQLQQAQAELAHSRSLADQGLAVERASRVEENRAMAIKQLHEANKMDEQALLEKVRVLKELEMLDLAHIEKLITMANMLKANEQSSIQETKPLEQ